MRCAAPGQLKEGIDKAGTRTEEGGALESTEAKSTLGVLALIHRRMRARRKARRGLGSHGKSHKQESVAPIKQPPGSTFLFAHLSTCLFLRWFFTWPGPP